MIKAYEAAWRVLASSFGFRLLSSGPHGPGFRTNLGVPLTNWRERLETLVRRTIKLIIAARINQLRENLNRSSLAGVKWLMFAAAVEQSLESPASLPHSFVGYRGSEQRLPDYQHFVDWFQCFA